MKLTQNIIYAILTIGIVVSLALGFLSAWDWEEDHRLERAKQAQGIK